MKTRQQIIDETLKAHEATTGGPDVYSAIIQAELEKRLTEEVYLTCEDFAHFDVKCCDAACESEPHYEMIDVVLDDDQHAWVCCHIRDILIRRTKKPPAPGRKAKKKGKLVDGLFDGEPDPVAERLHAGNVAATSDEEKLYYCLKYAHHKSGRKSGDQSLDSIVQQALKLPGGRPTKGFSESNPPQNYSLCFLCGALTYLENLIPETNYHNCKVMRELLQKNRESHPTEDTQTDETQTRGEDD